MIITPKNWKDFQHYKHRNPPWIKLHKSLLDNYEFHSMSDASKSLALCLWLIASESDDGSIDADQKKLSFRFRTTIAKIDTSLNELINNGFFITDSKPIAQCKHDASTMHTNADTEKSRVEKSRVEKSREKISRASRISKDFTLPHEWKDWYFEEEPTARLNDLKTTFDKFKDYWLAKAGKDGFKLDWFATWRNWVRREKEFSGNGVKPKYEKYDHFKEIKKQTLTTAGENHEHNTHRRKEKDITNIMDRGE